MTLTLSGSWSEGRNNNDKCISLYEFDKHATFKLEYGEDPCVQAYLSNSFCLWNLGYAQQAAQSIAQSIELAQRLEHANSIGYALCSSALLDFLGAKIEQTLTTAETAIAYSQEADLLVWEYFPRAYRGWAWARLGNPDEGIAEARSGINGWLETGAVASITNQFAALADACRATGRFDEALEAIDEGLGYVEDSGEGFREIELYRLRGLALLENDPKEHSEPEKWFAKALETSRNQQSKSMELRSATSLARLWRGQGKTDQARDLLAPIHGWFSEGFDSPDLKEARALLDELG
jgi:predicted ATPase